VLYVKLHLAIFIKEFYDDDDDDGDIEVVQ